MFFVWFLSSTRVCVCVCLSVSFGTRPCLCRDSRIVGILLRLDGTRQAEARHCKRICIYIYVDIYAAEWRTTERPSLFHKAEMGCQVYVCTMWHVCLCTLVLGKTVGLLPNFTILGSSR